MTTLSNFSRATIGSNAISKQVVCNDGIIRMVRTEQFTEGFVAYLVKEDGTYTNNTCYSTARKAINQAVKW